MALDAWGEGSEPCKWKPSRDNNREMYYGGNIDDYWQRARVYRNMENKWEVTVRDRCEPDKVIKLFSMNITAVFDTLEEAKRYAEVTTRIQS